MAALSGHCVERRDEAVIALAGERCGPPDPLRRGPLPGRLAVERAGELGGQNGLVATTAERVADDRLRCPLPP